jgi:protein-S-isoprenylcysteine O-methyltransferase Ste14
MRRSEGTSVLTGLLYARAVVALVLPALAVVVVPALLLRGPEGRMSIGGARLLGVPPLVVGGWLLLDSVFLRFAREGRGTLAPVDPPRRVVRGGAYRLVRNPMYVANVLIVTGSGIVFRSWHLLVWATVMFVAFHLFVVAYEEPTLRRRFGAGYHSYQREVGRWVPHRRQE